MNYRHFLTLALVVFAGAFSAQGQIIPDRPLSWIHGYNENGVFWQRYFNRFPVTHHVSAANSTNNAYTSNGSIGAISQAQGMLLPNFDIQDIREWPIAIGHSMGGIVAREIDQRWNVDFWKFSSMVTVGTPHNGLFAIRAIRTGMLREAALRATKAIAAGPAFDITGAAFNNLMLGNFDIGAVTGLTFWEGGKDVIQTVGKDLWEKNVQGYLNGYLQEPASQLEFNSQYITALRNTQTGKPIVTIWGNEEFPMCWRMLSVAVRTAQIPTDPLDVSPDGEMVHWAKTLQNLYTGGKYTHIGFAVLRGVMGFVNKDPWALQDLTYHIVGADAYAEGANYLDTGAENDYRHIIGAIWTETLQKKRDQFYYNGKNIIKIPSATDFEPDIQRDKWDFGYQEIHLLHNDPADALVTGPSQNAIINVTQTYEALGAGHLEQGNHIEVRRRLNQIFGRPETWFNTPERP